jgi:hypothetical protein
MQRVVLKQQGVTKIHSQACRVLPGHGTGAHSPAVNDDLFYDENNSFWRVISLLGNVIGGTFVLTILFLLPHIVARLMD